jgi:hypothetical protein
MRTIVVLIATVLLGSCAPLPPVAFLAGADVAPPVVTRLQFRSPTELEVGFDEPVRLVADPLYPPTVSALHVDEREEATLVFRFDPAPSPTEEHYVEAQVADAAGNHLRFVARFHGLNALVPAMIINELVTSSSTNHGEFVEIRILSDGNLAGATLYEGIPNGWDQRFTFPSVDVVAGDYVVVHFRPQGIPEEINETTDRSASGGRNASPEAWDFWVPGGTGLSTNNGVLTLVENPLGGYIDAVIYTNRTSDSDTRYRGFGSTKMLSRAEAVAQARQWVAAEGLIVPEDAIHSGGSTATRSMSRRSDGRDTNSAADWHITPTRGATPGSVNTDDVHAP